MQILESVMNGRQRQMARTQHIEEYCLSLIGYGQHADTSVMHGYVSA